MTTTTARFGLPLLVPGQAQKELFHNEALTALDSVVNATVEAVGALSPPAAPGAGRSWVTGSTPQGDWRGHGDALATWTDGGWRFQAPIDGMRVTVRGTGMPWAWDGARWREGEVHARRVLINGTPVLGPRSAAIADPSGGAAVDAEARSAIVAMLQMLRAHGLIA